jgi:hypothetical protein
VSPPLAALLLLSAGATPLPSLITVEARHERGHEIVMLDRFDRARVSSLVARMRNARDAALDDARDLPPRATIRVQLRFEDGTRAKLSSDFAAPFGTPWRIEWLGRTRVSWDRKIGSTLAAILPARFPTRDLLER